MRLRNVLPGLMIFAASSSVPANDSSSRLVACLRGIRASRQDVMQESLSTGKRSSCSTESISMPRNTMWNRVSNVVMTLITAAGTSYCDEVVKVMLEK